VAASNPDEDRLHKQVIESNEHHLLNIPVTEVGDVLQLELGLVLKKIVKVVCVIPSNIVGFRTRCMHTATKNLLRRKMQFSRNDLTFYYEIVRL